MRSHLARSLLGLLCAAAVAFAPEPDGEKIREYWPDGTLKAEYVVDSQGRRSGLSREWHENGESKSKVIFKLGLMEGPYESWHDNGKPDLSCRYRKGSLEGPWRQDRADGTPVLSCSYKNNELEGLRTAYDDAGRAAEETEYRAGKRDGMRRLYQGGELLSEQEYRSDLLVGLFGSRHLYSAPLEEVWLTLSELMAAPELQRLDQIARESGDPTRRLKADRALALARLRGFRYLAQVPWRECALDEEACARASDAAELSAAIGSVDFAPENPDWEESRFQRARDALLRCNLSQGWGLVGSIDAWINPDDRALFPKLTARRLCLEPRMAKIGVSQSGAFSSLWTGDSSGPVWNEEASFFPAKGWMPVEWFSADTAWSLRLNPSHWQMPDAREARVSVRALDENFLLHGESFPITELHTDREMLIFRPEVTVLPGFLYWVEVEGIAKPDGTPGKLAWLVHFTAQREQQPAVEVAPAGG
ncbi:MAG: hypothetical protein O3A20_03760 [Planctomycetota bacterium]|nr:hypothetical protein [Planctomycetota bacterium]